MGAMGQMFGFTSKLFVPPATEMTQPTDNPATYGATETTEPNDRNTRTCASPRSTPTSPSMTYILIIPAFGVISIVISGISQKIISGNQSMIYAMSCISLLGSVVWGHHMYSVGLETDTRAYFSGVTILISLPTGTKI